MEFRQPPINEHLIKPHEVDSVEEISPGGTGPKNGGASSSNGGVAGAKKVPMPEPLAPSWARISRAFFGAASSAV